MRLISFVSAMLAAATFSPLDSTPQDSAPVSWNCEWDHVSGIEGTITITASLASGWHLYSQYMEEGGPIPTQLNFIETSDFNAIGKIVEQGSPYTYYDSLYEIDITLYSHQVIFLQKIKLNKPLVTIKCDAVFMICNDDQCIPMKETFSIQASTTRDSP